MRNFRDEYRDMLGEMPVYSLDADKIIERDPHRHKIRSGGFKRPAMAAAVAGVCLLLSAGTAAAVNFGGGLALTDNGVQFWGGEGVLVADTDPAEENMDAADEVTTGKGDTDAGTIQMFTLGSSNSGSDSGNDDVEETEGERSAETGEQEDSEEETVIVMDMPLVTEYDSVESFLHQTGCVIAIPSSGQLGAGEEALEERVTAIGVTEDVSILLSFTDRTFLMTQEDYRGYESYSSSHTYYGETANERVVTDSLGFSWQVFDIVREDGGVDTTCAAISVNGRNITMSFSGYKEDEIDTILQELDLSVYFEEEDAE